MAYLVLKFGGTSVADIEHIRNAAQHVVREIKEGHKVTVVVSAMAGATNELVSYVRQVSPACDMREYDAVVSSGEQVTAGLMALILQAAGLKARALQGWQVPIQTNATYGNAAISSINGETLVKLMDEGITPVIAGFQGVAPDGSITTLGRGGSDTSAVAIAAAINAERCDIYTDVDGIYTADPRMAPQAQKLSRVAYEEMLEMASLGAKVLHVRAAELAMRHSVQVLVRSSFAATHKSELEGTLVCEENQILENKVVSGIAYASNEAKVTLLGLSDRAGIAGDIFSPLAEAAINVDMIVQNVSSDGKTIDLTFTVPAADFERTMTLLEKNKPQLNYCELRGDKAVAKISCIGVGMRTHAGVAARMFQALGEKGVNIQAITTSEIKISILIDKTQTELAVRTLHSLYGLDRA
jgi:aspartate kinase